MAVISQHVEEQRGSQHIRAGVVANPIHGLAGPGFRCQMDNGSDIPQGLNPVPALANVAPHYLDVVLLKQRTQLGLRIDAMDLRVQIVHQAHFHAAPDQCPGEGQPDEPEPPGNQDLLGHPLILTCLLSIHRHLSG